MASRSVGSKVFTQLNAYIAVFAVLLIFDLVMATRLIVAWHDSHSDESAQYDADMLTYGQLQAQTAHLRGLPAKLASARSQEDRFVTARIPVSDSAVLTDLGALKDRDHVQLSRASYAFAPAIPGLLEMRIDANVSGPYTSVMHFINDLERDKDHAFFILRSITLSGQQNGGVNLRVRMTTYMQADHGTAAMLEAGKGNAGEVE